MSLKKTITLLVAVSVFALCFASPASAYKKVKWAAINPNLKGATSVGKTGECLLCHEDSIKHFERTIHAKAYRAKYGKELATSCEVCHGPLSNHLAAEYDDKASTVVSFKNISARKKNYICRQCHEKGNRMHWRGSAHEMSDVSCTNCHTVMQRKSKRFLLADKDPKKVCFQCHRGKRAKILRSSHMPLREGKMGCADCHNPHGGIGPSLLKQATVNETCYICHQEKRGPLIWEHAPVRENCATCHDSHGSNFKPLLKRKLPYLCQQCHMDAFHPSGLYDGADLAGRNRDLIGKSCLNCHSMIHGSNHPSGARFQR